MNKVIVIAGPTATGKTALSVRLAKEIGGEVISADSVQIHNMILNLYVCLITRSEEQPAERFLWPNFFVQKDILTNIRVDF